MGLARTAFGTTPEGEPVDQYALVNARGLAAKVITYGARLTELHVPDRAGRFADVVLGFDSLEPYLPDGRYFGATIGRVANRIAGGKFSLDGHLYRLSTNEDGNTLHGGVRGFDKRLWRAEPFEGRGARGVQFKYLSPHMEEGFPGDLTVTVTYTLDDRDELAIAYDAVTDQTTPVNLTNHSYFNLAGAGSGDALGHVLTLAAPAYTPVDAAKIPTGDIRPVRASPMDFTAPTPVGARIGDVEGGDGYDHNFVLDAAGDAGGPAGTDASAAVTLHDPGSGRTMEIRTTQPGMQFYSGNLLDGRLSGIGGPYGRHGALVFEPQHFPDSVHHRHFPCTILRPRERYRQASRYRFRVGVGAAPGGD
jgi:aldose 1-epimerase